LVSPPSLLTNPLLFWTSKPSIAAQPELFEESLRRAAE